MQVNSKEGGLAMLVDAAEAAPSVPLPIKKRKVAEPTTECRHAENQAAASKPSSEMESAHSREHFPQFLMSVLENEEYHDQIAWMPSGEAFTVVNTKAFKTDIMPKLFKIRIMSSFIRKLSRWGFHRVHDRHSKNSDIFRHDDFQRGRWDLCKTIKSVAKPSITAAYRGNSHVARTVSTSPGSVEETRTLQAPVSPEGARSPAEGRPLGPPPSFLASASRPPRTISVPMNHANHSSVDINTVAADEWRRQALNQQARALASLLKQRSTRAPILSLPPTENPSAYQEAMAKAKAMLGATPSMHGTSYCRNGAATSFAGSITPPSPSEALVQCLHAQLKTSPDTKEAIAQAALVAALSKMKVLDLLQSILGNLKKEE